jgi:hypothetical protein
MRPTALVVMLLGGALAICSLPRVAASLLAAPGDAVIGDLQSGKPLDPHSIDLLIASRRSALSLVENSELRVDLGWGLLVRGAAGDAPAMRQAIEQLRSALRHAPARPRGWTTLASALIITEGPSPEVAAALHMAMITEPAGRAHFEDAFLVRLRLCLLSLDYFSVDDREEVMRDLRMAWGTERYKTSNIVYETKTRDVLKEALKADPQALAELKSIFPF